VQLSNTVIIGGLFVIAAALAVHELVAGEGLEAGKPAPDVTLVRLDGTPLPLGSLKGRVVLLNFWATWCPPCVEEMPELVAIAKEYEAKGVVFVASNQEDPGEAQEAVPAWLARHPAVGPYVALGDDSVAQAFAVQALPTTYVLDREGRVLEVARGQVQGWRVKKWLDDALAK
jgi:thiol-disulfide isomerase/thioredoxin